MDNRYKPIEEDLIRLAATMNPGSDNYNLILEEGRKIRLTGSEPVYFLDTENESVFVLDYNEVMAVIQEENSTIN